MWLRKKLPLPNFWLHPLFCSPNHSLSPEFIGYVVKIFPEWRNWIELHTFRQTLELFLDPFSMDSESKIWTEVSKDEIMCVEDDWLVRVNNIVVLDGIIIYVIFNSVEIISQKKKRIEKELRT